MGEKPVPVVLPPLRVPGPVRLFGVDEDDPRLPVPLVVVAPDVPVGFRVGAVLAGLAEPWVLVAGVVHDQVGDDPDPPPVGVVHQLGHVSYLSVLGQDGPVVRDVVTAVAQRGLVEGQQPNAVDAQPLQVVELAHDARDIARTVVVGVEEPANQDFVENRPLVPADVLAGGTGDGRYRSSRSSGPAHLQTWLRTWRMWATRSTGSNLTKGWAPMYSFRPKARRTPRSNAPGLARGLPCRGAACPP